MNLLPALLGCAVCMGQSDARTAPALNAAIFLLLGCIGGMLGLITTVGWSIVRRSHRASEVPPSDDLPS